MNVDKIRHMRQVKDYNKGKIYVLRNHTNDKVYVGSTTSPLYKRFSYHKSDMKQPKNQNRKLYEAMREIGFENFYIELVEDYPCENIEQLEAREGHWQRELDSYNNGYNGKIQGRSKKEWKKDNKEKISAWQKNWVKENKEKIVEQLKKYCESNRDKLLEYKKAYYRKNIDKVLEYQKEYREKHGELIRGKKQEYYQKKNDKLLEYQKEYREKNKDTIKAKNQVKVKCECGNEVNRSSLSRHYKSIKHQDYMKSK